MKNGRSGPPLRPCLRAWESSSRCSYSTITPTTRPPPSFASAPRATPACALVDGPALPAGWCGKQHACWVLAHKASFDVLLFLDADVRLASDGLARMVAFLHQSGADLVSGIPFQETPTLIEKLVIPIIHFVLLGFLPLRRMRASRNPAYGAGCGQLFLAKRSSYEKAGGHSAIRTTLHDGVKLSRSFRAAGLVTDLCDATPVARCRMYKSADELWHGLAKNAIEGLGAPSMIVPSTLLLLGGQVSPLVLLALSIWHSPAAILPAVAATVCVYNPRPGGCGAVWPADRGRALASDRRADLAGHPVVRFAGASIGPLAALERAGVWPLVAGTLRRAVAPLTDRRAWQNNGEKPWPSPKILAGHALTEDASAAARALRHAASTSSRSSLTRTFVEAASRTASA